MQTIIALFQVWVLKNPFGLQPETAYMQRSRRYFCDAPLQERHRLQQAQHNTLNYGQQRHSVSCVRSMPLGARLHFCPRQKNDTLTHIE